MREMTLAQFACLRDPEAYAFVKDGKHPFIIYKGTWYQNLGNFLRACPSLANKANPFDSSRVEELADVVNWLFHCDLYHVDRSFTPCFDKMRFCFQIQSKDGSRTYRVSGPVLSRLPSSVMYKYSYTEVKT